MMQITKLFIQIVISLSVLYSVQGTCGSGIEKKSGWEKLSRFSASVREHFKSNTTKKKDLKKNEAKTDLKKTVASQAGTVAPQASTVAPKTGTVGQHNTLKNILKKVTKKAGSKTSNEHSKDQLDSSQQPGLFLLANQTEQLTHNTVSSTIQNIILGSGLGVGIVASNIGFSAITVPIAASILGMNTLGALAKVSIDKLRRNVLTEDHQKNHELKYALLTSVLTGTLLSKGDWVPSIGSVLTGSLGYFVSQAAMDQIERKVDNKFPRLRYLSTILSTVVGSIAGSHLANSIQNIAVSAYSYASRIEDSNDVSVFDYQGRSCTQANLEQVFHDCPNCEEAMRGHPNFDPVSLDAKTMAEFEESVIDFCSVDQNNY